MLKGVMSVMSGAVVLFAAMPAGTTYKLQSYGVGSGGTGNSSSSSYAMEGISGEINGANMSGASYRTMSGMISTQLANVPGAPTLSNPNNYYNKLHLVIDNGANPTDARFAVAISKDNFVTTQYVQSDLTVGSSLGIEDYLTYPAWGSATGVNIIGLEANTPYKAKVRAMHGTFTESAYSAEATSTTVNPSLSFDLDVSASDSESSAPYDLAFDDLSPGAVISSSSKIWVDFDTNGESGGNVYVYGKNSGLRSATAAHTIDAVTGDLSAASQGFGVQSGTAGQANGGPLTIASPYDGANDEVGITDANIRKIYSTTAPILGGRSSMQLKAKVATLTPASTDYSEILTVIGAPSF